MPIAKYVGGPTVTELTSTDLESTGTEFICSSLTDDPQQTGYNDIKAGIIGNPGALGGVTPATSLAVAGTVGLDGAVTVNESGADVDMRVEGDTDVNLLYADAGTDRVGIGTNTPATKLDVVGTITGDGLAVAGTVGLDGAVTINESGADVDMRVEGDTDVNLFYADAGNDRVGIGTSTPATKLDVVGTITGDGLTIAGASSLDGAVTINETGAAVDTRIESDNNTHMLFVDASADSIGINNSTPASDVEVDITGRLRVSDAVFYDEMWTGAASEWATRVTTGSVAAQSKDNGWIRLTTGAVLTNEESLDWNDICPFANTKRPSFEVRVQLEQVTLLECYFGLIESSGVGTDDFILLSFDAYSQNTWYLEASTAGVATTDMGAVATTNQVELRFVFTSDTALEWFVDGVSQGTVATNVPTVQLQPVLMIKTQAAAAHYVDIDYVKIWQDRT